MRRSSSPWICSHTPQPQGLITMAPRTGLVSAMSASRTTAWYQSANFSRDTGKARCMISSRTGRKRRFALGIPVGVEVAEAIFNSKSPKVAPMPSSPPAATPPFAAFEWMIALRYLRARRREGFVSVISGFSLVGIALGVATLIIVMSVMGGFRKEFLASVLGFNGHVIVQAAAGPLPNFDAMTARLKAVPGVTRAAPIADGQ